MLVLTAAVSLLCSQSVFAETLELDLDDAVQRAFDNEIRRLRSLISEKKGSRAELNAARAGRGISIDAEHRSGRGGYADPQLNTATSSYSKNLGNSHSNSITASIPIYTGGQLSGTIDQAKANYKAMLWVKPRLTSK